MYYHDSIKFYLNLETKIGIIIFKNLNNERFLSPIKQLLKIINTKPKIIKRLYGMHPVQSHTNSIQSSTH